MKIEGLFLTLQQMESLRSLGLDTSDAGIVLIYKDDEGNECSWDEVKFTPKGEPYIEDYGDVYDVYPEYLDAENGNYDHSYREESVVYTLQEVIGKLPRYIENNGKCYSLSIDFGNDDGGCIRYDSFRNDEYPFEWTLNTMPANDDCDMIEAAYEMLYWVLEYGYLKKKKQ